MFKMVFVVNSSLKMTTGKVASQTAHSAVSLYIKATTAGSGGRPRGILGSLLPRDMDVWVRHGQTKVVLKGRDESHLGELERQAEQLGLATVAIRDAGRTQIAPGSLTCLAIFGRISQLDSVTGQLPLYN